MPRAGGNFDAGRALVSVSMLDVPMEVEPTTVSAYVKLLLSEAF